MRAFAVFVALLAVGLSAEAQVLSARGYGAIRFGQSLIRVEQATRQKATPPRSKEGCYFVEFTHYPGVSFMVEDGIVTRADATNNRRNTASISVGSRLSEARNRFPSGRIEPHHYDDHGHYFILDTPDRKAALLFEESDGRITNVRAGLQPSVEYVEGCS